MTSFSDLHITLEYMTTCYLVTLAVASRFSHGWHIHCCTGIDSKRIKTAVCQRKSVLWQTVYVYVSRNIQYMYLVLLPYGPSQNVRLATHTHTHTHTGV